MSRESPNTQAWQATEQLKTNMIMMYLSVFLDYIGFSIIQPILPSYALQFNANGVMIGLVMTSFSTASTISSFVKGKLSDKHGRRPMILFSLFGTFFGFLLTAFAQNYTQLLIFRTINGSFGMASGICKAYIVDMIPQSSHALYFSYLGATISVAYIIGPIVGSGVAKLFSIRAAYLTSSALGAIGFVITFFKLKESFQSPDKADQLQINEFEDTANPEKDETNNFPEIIYLFSLSVFVQTLAMAAYMSMYPLYLIRRHQFNEIQVGLSTVCIAICYSVTSGYLFNKIQKRIGLENTPIVGSMVCAVSMVYGIVVAENGYVILSITMMCISIGFGDALFDTAIPPLAANHTNQTNRGKIMGVVECAGGAAWIIGPLLFGLIFDIHESYPFILGAFCALYACILSTLPQCCCKSLNKQPISTDTIISRGENVCHI
eukprot:198519_1